MNCLSLNNNYEDYNIVIDLILFKLLKNVNNEYVIIYEGKYYKIIMEYDLINKNKHCFSLCFRKSFFKEYTMLYMSFENKNKIKINICDKFSRNVDVYHVAINPEKYEKYMNEMEIFKQILFTTVSNKYFKFHPELVV